MCIMKSLHCLILEFYCPSLFITMTDFSTKKISSELLAEIKEAIKDKYYGSVEIYIQDNRVTQITERVIRKLGEVKSKEQKRR